MTKSADANVLIGKKSSVWMIRDIKGGPILITGDDGIGVYYVGYHHHRFEPCIFFQHIEFLFSIGMEHEAILNNRDNSNIWEISGSMRKEFENNNNPSLEISLFML